MSRMHGDYRAPILSSAAILWTCTTMALAQTAPSDRVEVPAVLVEGDASPAQRVDLASDSVANPSRVAPSSRPHTQTFTQQDIEALKPSNVYDLLSHATGVLTTYQGRKLSYNLQIRGDSNYGFILDGAYIPLSTAGRILQMLPIALIEQVDVVRDPSALTLGPLVNFDSASGALNSGFIVIRTHRPEKTEATVRASVESYGTFTTSGYAGTTFVGGLDQPNAYVGGLTSHMQTNGPSSYNMWANSTAGLLKGGISAGVLQTDWTIFQDRARYGFERAKAGQSTSTLVAQKWSYSPIDTTLLTSNSLFNWNAVNSTLLSFSYNTVSANNIQASYANNAVSANYDRTYTIDTNLRHNIKLDQTLIQIGGEYVSFYTPTGQVFYSGYANREETFSAYVNAEQKFLADRLKIDASARLDDHRILQGIDLYNAGNGSGSGGKTNLQYFYNRTLPLAKNYAAGASFLIVPQLLATARASHTEQGELTNIVSESGAPLDPETQNKWEIGLEAPISPFMTLAFNFFDTRIDNDKTATSYKVFPNNNYPTPLWSQSNTHRQGFELIGRGTVATSDWFGQTGYRTSWMHLTQASSSSLADYGQTLAHDIVNLSLTQTWTDYNGTLALNYAAPYLSNFNSADGKYHSIGNFVVVDLSLGRRFKLGPAEAKLSVYGRNITNRKYETVYGFPAWGAVWGSEFSVTF